MNVGLKIICMLEFPIFNFKNNNRKILENDIYFIYIYMILLLLIIKYKYKNKYFFLINNYDYYI